ncbi:MAG TPA: hypothetical protein VEL07_08580 [Planctomycetota bacterium]|nr:hypothetical protein [Planctomycetota bacterium]
MSAHAAPRPLPLVLLVASAALAAVEPLPEGATGIAARHPGDVGIAADPAVVFADDFESYADADALRAMWDLGVDGGVRIATATDAVFAGGRAAEFALPTQDAEAGASIRKRLFPERDVLFLRCYAKLDRRFDVVGSSHNGFGVGAHYDVDGRATPGIPADGRNKFLVHCECWRGDAGTPSPGSLNVYVYHPEQRSEWGDHFFPTGIVMPSTSTPFPYADGFVARPEVVPELGRWYCYELMVQANTPGARDGRIAFWLDGRLVADLPGLRLRDVAELTIDTCSFGLHVHDHAKGETKWCDNVVVATSYIGPFAGADHGAD